MLLRDFTRELYASPYLTALQASDDANAPPPTFDPQYFLTARTLWVQEISYSCICW